MATNPATNAPATENVIMGLPPSGLHSRRGTLPRPGSFHVVWPGCPRAGIPRTGYRVATGVSPNQSAPETNTTEQFRRQVVPELPVLLRVARRMTGADRPHLQAFVDELVEPQA